MLSPGVRAPEDSAQRRDERQGGAAAPGAAAGAGEQPAHAAAGR